MIWLIKQIDSIIFGLSTNLLCIFDTCWVSTAVVLVKNDVYHIPWLKDVAVPALLSHSTISNFYQSANLKFLGLVIPQIKIFFDIGRNYVSIIVTIVSNITMLQRYLPWIFVSIRRLLQFIVCIGVSTPPQKHQPLFFC